MSAAMRIRPFSVGGGNSSGASNRRMSALTWVRMMAEQPIVWVLVLGFALGLALLVGGLLQITERRAGPGPRRFEYRRRRKPDAPSLGAEQQPSPLRWRRVARGWGRKK
jgi:hypothetical protein